MLIEEYGITPVMSFGATVSALVVRYVEHLLDFLEEGESLLAANRQLLDELAWPHFWAVQILLSSLLFVYCSLHGLVGAIGARLARPFERGETRG